VTVRGRLLLISRLQLLGELVTVVSNSSLLVLLGTNTVLTGPLGYGAVTTSLLSALMLVWIRRLNGSLLPGENPLLDRYSKLLSLHARAEDARVELQIWLKLATPGRETPEDALARAPGIGTSNKICRELRQIIAHML
jgi:hypothetical protein